MLKRISIENFKGIGRRVDIALRPITLLFGPNSAGKSTILHALHYAHALLESGNADVGRTRLGGDIDLGGFQQLVHDHDLDAAVVIGFGLALDAGDVAYHFEAGSDPYEQREVMAELDAPPRTGQTATADLGNMFAGIGEVPAGDWSLEVEMRIRWSPYLKRPMVDRFTVRWWDQPFAEVGASLDGAHAWVTNVNMAHPMLRPYAAASEGDPPLLTTKLGCRHGRGHALPRQRLYLDEVDAVGGVTIARDIDDHLHMAATIVQDKLERLLYVGPVRAVVPRHYQPPKHPQRARWANGLGAWDALARDASLRHELSHWLADEQRLGTGYRVQWRHYRELDEDTYERMLVAAQDFDLDESFPAMAAALPARTRLVVLDETKNLELAPCDLGEGINQVVPVIAAALAPTVTTADGRAKKTELVAIEQPELHIHPRMQVVLGDLFLSQCGERQFLIETHSEHLMLRLLKRVRETADGELGEASPPATVDTVAVYYVDQHRGEVHLTPLRVTDEGEFRDRWPAGFFPERLAELL